MWDETPSAVSICFFTSDLAMANSTYYASGKKLAGRYLHAKDFFTTANYGDTLPFTPQIQHPSGSKVRFIVSITMITRGWLC